MHETDERSFDELSTYLGRSGGTGGVTKERFEQKEKLTREDLMKSSD